MVQRRHNAFNIQGQEYVSDTERFQESQRARDQQDWMMMQKMQQQQAEIDAARGERGEARDYDRGQVAMNRAERGQALARTNARQDASDDWVMVDGVPVFKNQTTWKHGRAQHDPNLTTDQALAIALQMRGSAADQSGYANSLQGKKNEVGLANVDRQSVVDEYNMGQKTAEWDAGQSGRDLAGSNDAIKMSTNRMLAERIAGGGMSTGEQRALEYGQSGNWLQNQYASEAATTKYARDGYTAATESGHLTPEVEARIAIENGMDPEVAEMMAANNSARSQNMFNNIFQPNAKGEMTIANRHIDVGLQNIRDIANRGFAAWDHNDRRDVVAEIARMIEKVDLSGMQRGHLDQTAIGLLDGITAAIDESGMSTGKSEAHQMARDTINKLFNRAEDPESFAKAARSRNVARINTRPVNLPGQLDY